MLTRYDIPKLVEQLDGTCQSLDDVLREDYGVEFASVPIELLDLLDEHVMQCETCGWWSDASGFDDNQVCDECRVVA